MSGEVSASAPTTMVPVSGASPLAGPPAPPPPDAVPPLPSFDAVLAYVPNASDADSALAAERREAAERSSGIRPDADEAPSVPAVWTTAPARVPDPGLGVRTVMIGGALAAALVLGVTVIWWMLQRPAVPISTAAEPPPAAAVPAPAPPPTEAPTPSTDVTPPAAGLPAAPARPGVVPGATPVRPSTGPAVVAATPDVPAEPRPTGPARPPSAALLAQAATMLSEAQGLLQTGSEADGLARIAALRASFGGTPPAREGALLAARTHHQARRYDEAAAAWIDAARDGVGPEDISEGLIQAADGAARQRTAESDIVARRTLGEILDRYPTSVRALRALQMKMSIEDRMKLKEPDGELNGVAPTSLLTLRKTARGAGTAPVAEFALWRLGQEYRDRRLYDLAATTFTDLGTRFPGTRYEAWFSAAELFEKQLKDPARARDAYGKVPAASPRYDAAQKKLTSA
jgi:hypothetical protein